MAALKMITYQCRYCGRKTVKSSTQVPLKPGCSKAPSKMHSWAKVK